MERAKNGQFDSDLFRDALHHPPFQTDTWNPSRVGTIMETSFGANRQTTDTGGRPDAWNHTRWCQGRLYIPGQCRWRPRIKNIIVINFSVFNEYGK